MEIGKLDIESFLKSLPEQQTTSTVEKKTSKRAVQQLFAKSSKKSKKTAPPPPVEEEEVEEEEVEGEEDEEKLHMKELQALAETDPEFYESLQNEAKDLLEFGQEEENEEDDQVDDEEEEGQTFDMEEIKRLDKKSQRGDVVSIRRLIRIFRDAMLQPMDSLPTQEDNATYEHLLKTSLVCIARGLDVALGVTKQNPKPKPNSALAHPIRQLLICLTKLIGSKNTSPSVLQHVLQNSRLFCSFFTSTVPIEGKKFVNTLITIWGREDTEGPIRLAAFFRMRQMCTLDKELLNLCLRDCYVSFARNAKSFRVDAVKERIGLQARCLVELYSMDRDAGYRVAFLHIRQLALHVRSALASKTQESLQSISSWQFMHCLRLWGFILMENDLNNLDFPFLQVALGVLSLFHGSNSSRYLPLQLHCIEIINRLCERKQIYAPVGLHCVELCANLVLKKVVPCTDTMTPGELQSMLKFKAESAQHANVRLAVIPIIFTALREHLKTHRTSVAFPELFSPIAKQLKAIQFDKRSSDAWKLQAVKQRDLLLKDGDEWAKIVREGRATGGSAIVTKPPTGPGDVAGCDAFRKRLAEYYVERSKKEAQQAPPAALFETKQKVNLIEPKFKKTVAIAAAAENEEEEEGGEEEEGVGALNPKDFL